MGRWWHNDDASPFVKKEWHGEIDIIAFADAQQHHAGLSLETDETPDNMEPFA
jgi:hypothetical protein